MIYVYNITYLFLAINYKGLTFATKEKKMRIEGVQVGLLVHVTFFGREILEKINN